VLELQAARAARVTYATAKFSIAPGTTKTVRAQLSKRGRKLLRKGRNVVRVNAKATLSGGRGVVSRKIALRLR
jgi:hypothetical protein